MFIFELIGNTRQLLVEENGDEIVIEGKVTRRGIATVDPVEALRTE